MRRILVTSALPYANGHIHIGHLVEYLQTDIWVRFQKLRGNRCLYMCADDTHGTAIMISAKAQGITEEELLAKMRKSHLADFNGFHIEFDNYGSTNSEENREYCAEIWAGLRKADLVFEKSVTQLYDTEVGTFLADRFVKGTCPKCGASGQYGDNCDKCGAHYRAAELIDPISTLSNTKPELRSANHLFVAMEKVQPFLEKWTKAGHLQAEISNYLANYFLNEPLKPWDISRTAPYFGFEIPDSPGNYWYVWFDAPIGYIASTRQWCDRHGENCEDWWKSDTTEIHHFIGKDITYFHTLFWPAMLKTAGFSLPKRIQIHGFLTVDGEKMSKSKGTFILASKYLEHLDPSYLRYYYATKLTSRVDDIDLNFEDFIARVNSDLVNKVVNLASRTAKFVHETGLSTEYPDDGGLFADAAAKAEEIAADYEACDYAKATRTIMGLCDKANQYVEHAAPWTLRKDGGKGKELQDVCTVGLNLFRQIVVYLAPVLPRLAEQAGELLNSPIASWEDVRSPLVGAAVSEFKHLMKRVEQKDVQAMIEESAVPEAVETPRFDDSDQPLKDEPLAEECTIEDFMKVDLRVARVIEAKQVPEANKLLELTLSLGGDVRRNVFAGIKQAYNPEDLVGRLVVCVANLKPRKMKFGLSEGMVCASGPGGPDVFVIFPDEGARPGQRVH